MMNKIYGLIEPVKWWILYGEVILFLFIIYIDLFQINVGHLRRFKYVHKVRI